MKKYRVSKIKNNSTPISDANWKEAVVLNEFSYPWQHKISNQTRFRALYDNTYLYLRYDVEDDMVQIYTETGKKNDVVYSDRVEIFFRKNKQLEPYYCLEIDPNGLVLDYAASYYRKFDFEWAWPKNHLFVTGTINPKGYRVDVTISLKSLQDLGLLHNNIIEAGIFRADCIELPKDCGGEASIKWISWVNPKSKAPDFHIPSSFGILELIA